MKQTYRNLFFGFTFSMVLLVISSAASLLCIRGLLRSGDLVRHTHLVLENLDATYAIVRDAETAQRGYLLSDDEHFLAPYRVAREKVINTLDRIKRLTDDNPGQQVSCDALRRIVITRLDQLDHVVRLKQTAGVVNVQEVQLGREYMEKAGALINDMKRSEQDLLARRTTSLDRFATGTPVVIIFSSLAAILITIVFYRRVVNDFKRRSRLQQKLEEKDADISRRIALIQGLAGRIASGDYDVTAEDEGADGLGSLSESINKMAASLKYSFGRLSDREWLQAGLAKLNEQLLGVADLEQLTQQVISFAAIYSGSQVGALYLAEDNRRLQLSSTYALAADGRHATIAPGEGLAGQCARDRQLITLTDIPDDHLTLYFSSGAVRPRTIVALPLIYDQEVAGVLELGTLRAYPERELSFLREASGIIGTAITTARSRARLQELLEETQAQSEELQAQHSELENINAELEAQALKLQASEEELRVQQEELLQANQELEERAHLLQERNEVIAERNREVQQKADQLALSTKYKSEFLANMSHELRTPLNSILLLSRLMYENTEQNLTPEQVEYARVIQSSGNGLLSLIDEILDLSKIEAGKMDLEWSEVVLEEVTDDMQALFAALAKEKGLEFRVEKTAGVPPVLETDKQRLEQILKNLLSNAFKFTRAGSVALRVSEGDDGNIRFSVKDTGIGIPTEKQQLIFEAFQQADGSTRRKYGGTGLGLSISRELARLLGGHLTLHSSEGAGAEFVVSVPPHRPETIPPPLPAPAPPLPEPSTEAAAPRKYLTEEIPAELPDDREGLTPDDKVILIVEDDTAFARSLMDFTRKKGYKCIVAVRGDEGLQLAFRYKPRAILLDIMLPVMDGWEVMQELKKSSETRHIPVHIMSAVSVKKESLQQGAVDFISKPVAYEQMNDMFSKLEQVLSKESKKVLIVEENPKHAAALAHFLSTFDISSEIASSVEQGVHLLREHEVDCVILDMGIPDRRGYETLETVKKQPGLEQLPIIIFTGKSLSKAEEQRIRQYAGSIIVKTAHSYKRMIDEVSLFLHLMEQHHQPNAAPDRYRKLGGLTEVLSGKTVLIADDDVRNIFSLTRSLEQHGVNVLSSTDGAEALELLAGSPGVNLVLMDMMMPGMDGYETTTRIRKDPKTRGLPVIAVTAKAMTGDREKCIQAGASDYITKPVDMDQLLSLLRVWLYDKPY